MAEASLQAGMPRSTRADDRLDDTLRDPRVVEAADAALCPRCEHTDELSVVSTRICIASLVEGVQSISSMSSYVGGGVGGLQKTGLTVAGLMVIAPLIAGAADRIGMNVHRLLGLIGARHVSLGFVTGSPLAESARSMSTILKDGYPSRPRIAAASPS